MVEEVNSDVLGVVRCGARDEVGTFSQAANNDIDAIMFAVGLGEAPDEVHRDGLPPGVDHDEELLFIGEVIHFGGKEFLASEGDGVFAGWGLGVGRGFLDGGSFGGDMRKILGQDGSNGEVGGIGSDVEMVSGVDDLEGGGGGDELFDGIEGVLAVVIPSEGFVLAGEFMKGVRDVREVADKEAVVDREDLAEMLKVGLECGAVSEDIIEIDDDTNFEEVAEDVLHCRLECGGGVRASEGHHEEFVVPESGMEGGLVGILLADADLVEATAEVDLATRSEMVDMVVFMLAMDDWMDVTMRRSVARSVAALGAGLEAMDWLGQFGFREELPAESEEEKEAFLKLLFEVKDEAEKWLLVEEKRASLHNRMLLKRRKESDEKKKMKEQGERLRQMLQEQKGKQVAIEERLTLLTDTLLHTNEQLVVLHQTVTKAEAQQGEFANTWNNFLNNASPQIDLRVRNYVEQLDEALCQRLKDPAAIKQLKIGGGGGDGGDDGDDEDKKGKVPKKEKDSEEEESRQKMKLLQPAGEGDKEEEVVVEEEEATVEVEEEDPPPRGVVAKVLLTSYLRCFPMPLRNQLAGEANINVHNFSSFSKKALDLEAKIGHGHNPTTEGKKKTLPPNWKMKGHIMFVDNDGSTIELDDNFQEGVGSEAGSVEASGGEVVAVVAQKGALITEFGLEDNVTQSMVKAYREDPFMSEIICRLEAKEKVTSAKFELVNDLLFLDKAGNKGLCVPNRESLRSLFLGECHDATRHFGFKKTAANLLQRFWWSTMIRVAKLYVETCQVCQRDKPRTQAPLGLLQPLPIPERPGESLSMDFMDTLVTSKSGMRHIFVIVDRFSKYARLVAMPETTKTEYVIRMFKDNWVRDFGLPKSIISDRDVRFTSKLWKAAAAEQGTQLQMTYGNHPEANDQAEQLNRAVQHLLRHYIKPNQVDWDEKLALIASLYNNAVHSATGVSPNNLLLTFKPRLPLDFLLPENQATAAPGTLEFAYRYEQKMQQAVEQMQKAEVAMIESANKHRRESSFQVGDRVWVKSSELGQEHAISRKLMPQYFGPWEVLDIVGTDPDGPSYVVRIPGHFRTYPVFHASKLAPFEETDQFPSRRSMLPPTMDGEVDIDDIVDHRELSVSRPTGRGRPPKLKLQYRVRFRHHTKPKEDRWFTREELM
ncbi:hypothetical protein CBR_g23260 [Chara braunii]|uniref:Integrase catalytic domain-containing protein n=1 Tax=Chara braunii TaxID=69332 RepID=A0A388JVB6_CHABU|nr:hypothetical protein CBR_g23260 [Chara braunii]|eukprot:GBG61746.1 hypothetical protein CBR_g23260 [Chara braunii]